MGKITSFTDIIAWKKGHSFVTEIYKATNSFPRSEIFGLTNQIRRAVVSITSNIAEGFGRTSVKERLQFYSISRGSILETQNQLLIARDVGYLHNNDFVKLADLSIEVHKLINGLITKTKENLS